MACLRPFHYFYDLSIRIFSRKANPSASSILLGVTLYRVFQASIIGGTRCLNNLNGGFKAERVSTKIVILSELTYRVIDVFLQTVLIFTILVLALGWDFLTD